AHMGRDYLIAALACRQVPAVKLILTRHHYLPLTRNALYRWMLKDVAAVIAVSDNVRSSVLERLQLAPAKVHTTRNWVDPSRFKAIDRAAARAVFKIGGAIVVACIGRVTPAKGQEEFVRASARVAQMRSDVEFVIAGEEQEQGTPFTRHLERIAVELGL